MWYLLLGILSGILIYFKAIKPAKYWEQRGVLNEPSWPLIGNVANIILMKEHPVDLATKVYNKYPKEKYVGLMQLMQPTLLIRDLDLIKQVTVKAFDHFHDHQYFASSKDDLFLSRSLFAITGDHWRRMRATVSPVFTSSKMRSVHELMTECAEIFVAHFKGKEQIAVEMKDIFARYMTDVIVSAVLGIRVDSLQDDNNKFFVNGKRLVNFTVIQFTKLLFMAKFKLLVNLLGIHLVPTDVTDFFKSVIKDNISQREKDGFVRPDLIHLLMEARKGQLKHETDEVANEGFATVEESDIGKSSKQLWLTDDDIVGQAMIFFFAGSDTASTASCFMARELALNPDVQRRLQEEIDSVNQQSNGKVSYETLLSMKYLDQVLSETLRLWPPAFQIDRVCTKEYVVEPQKPTVIEKGTSILIPLVAIHRDPQYFPEPNKFVPERFSDENKHKIVQGSYMPFGVGPRNCIGSRFALLEIKTLFFHLLTEFDVIALNNNQIPLKFDPRKVTLMPKNGFRLGLKPRNVLPY